MPRKKKAAATPEVVSEIVEVTPEVVSEIVEESIPQEVILPTPQVPVQDDFGIYTMSKKALMVPGDERQQHVTVRSFASEAERVFCENNRDSRWHHVRPNSVLIAAMGFHWTPGAWEKVIDMLLYTHEKGVYAGLSEMQDRCHDPYDALGTMRNEAILMAQNEGFEWILYLDNDVKPEKDFLINLLERDFPIISPYIVEPGTGKPLFGPSMSPNTGVHHAKWVVLSMLLCRTSIFTPFQGDFWADAIGADEGFHFQKLWRNGHRPYVDSDLQLIVDGVPHYPLSSNRLPWQERMELWDKLNRKRQTPPDRRPTTHGKDVDRLGQYMPWGALPGQEAIPVDLDEEFGDNEEEGWDV